MITFHYNNIKMLQIIMIHPICSTSRSCKNICRVEIAASSRMLKLFNLYVPNAMRCAAFIARPCVSSVKFTGASVHVLFFLF